MTAAQEQQQPKAQIPMQQELQQMREQEDGVVVTKQPVSGEVFCSSTSAF